MSDKNFIMTDLVMYGRIGTMIRHFSILSSTVRSSNSKWTSSSYPAFFRSGSITLASMYSAKRLRSAWMLRS